MTADQKAVISRLKDSLELHTIKRDFLIYLVFFGLMYLPSVSDNSGAATFTLLILIPILIFYIWRIICIFRDPEGYIFAECELAQPHSKDYVNSTVTIAYNPATDMGAVIG